MGLASVIRDREERKGRMRELSRSGPEEDAVPFF